MATPTARAMSLSSAQEQVLTGLVRAGTTTQQRVTRAKIMLAAADGLTNCAIAEELGLTRNTVQTWRGRWADAEEALLAAELDTGTPRLAGLIGALLDDAWRCGAPATFTPEQICRLVAIACEVPADADRPISQWTAREVADEAVRRGIVVSISVRSVGRFLGRGGSPAPSQSVLAHAPTR